jgi:hypothetical protein
MLAALTLVTIVGFGLLLYFSSSCAMHRAMNFTRGALAMALLGYALSEFCMQMMVYDHGDIDWLAGAAVVKGLGWIALLIGIKGIFAMLVTRADARRQISRPTRVSAPEPDLSQED